MNRAYTGNTYHIHNKTVNNHFKNKYFMKNLLKTTLLLLMSTSIFSVYAQKSSSDELTAKIGNTQWKSDAKTCTAV